MTSQFFVKFEYQDKIKKISILKDHFTWINMCKTLSKAFSISEDRIKLSYKDPDDDMITACCDDDLAEAYKLSSPKQTLKFFVIKDNKDQKKPRKDSGKRDYSRASSLKDQENSLAKALAVKKDYSEGQILLSEKKENIPLPVIEPKVEVKPINISYEDVEQILNTLLQTKEAKKEIRELKKRLGMVESSKDKDSQLINFDMQQQRLSDCITTAFKKLLLESIESDSQPQNNMSNQDKSNEEEKTGSNKLNSSNNFERNMLNASLKESIYENSNLNSLREAGSEDFKTRSFNASSTNLCRDLSSTHGVKLALKFENGKMKLMSIPIHEYSIIESVEEESEKAKRV